jgi:hypothetical protein
MIFKTLFFNDIIEPILKFLLMSKTYIIHSIWDIHFFYKPNDLNLSFHTFLLAFPHHIFLNYH